MFLPYSRQEIDSEFTHVLHFSFFILQTNGGFFILHTREAEATKFLFPRRSRIFTVHAVPPGTGGKN